MDNENQESQGYPRTRLDRTHLNAINAIIQNKIRVKLDQEAIKDDVVALGQQLNMKPAQINKLISLIMREKEQGDIISQETALLDLAEQVVTGGDKE